MQIRPRPSQLFRWGRRLYHQFSSSTNKILSPVSSFSLPQWWCQHTVNETNEKVIWLFPCHRTSSSIPWLHLQRWISSFDPILPTSISRLRQSSLPCSQNHTVPSIQVQTCRPPTTQSHDQQRQVCSPITINVPPSKVRSSPHLLPSDYDRSQTTTDYSTSWIPHQVTWTACTVSYLCNCRCD